jgi:hypothetical protein
MASMEWRQRTGVDRSELSRHLSWKWGSEIDPYRIVVCSGRSQWKTHNVIGRPHAWKQLDKPSSAISTSILFREIYLIWSIFNNWGHDSIFRIWSIFNKCFYLVKRLTGVCCSIYLKRWIFRLENTISLLEASPIRGCINIFMQILVKRVCKIRIIMFIVW